MPRAKPEVAVHPHRSRPDLSGRGRPGPGRPRPAVATAGGALVLALLLALSLFVPPAARAWRPEAQGIAPLSSGDVTFFVDVASLLDSGGKPRLRVFLEAPYDGLPFLPAADGLTATLDVTIVIYDREGAQISGDLWTVPLRVATAGEARDPTRFWRQHYDLPAEPGKLRVSVRVAETGSGRSGAWEGRLEMGRLGLARLALSDLILGRCVADSAAADPAYSGCLFVPGPGRAGSEESRVLCAWVEIYDRLDLPDSTYALRYEVVNPSGKVIETWNDVTPRRGGRGHYCLHPSLAGLKLGTFGLRVEARIGNETARVQRGFQTDEAQTDVMDDTRKSRALLGYVATSEELVVLEDLPTDSLSAFWSDFWRRRDPTPGTTRNENLQEFLRRVEYADTHFSVLEPGWNSDMGRIYIRYGGPDQIDRAPLGTSSSNHEVWHYFNRSLRFVFVDYEGFGRFRLIGSERG